MLGQNSSQYLEVTFPLNTIGLDEENPRVRVNFATPDTCWTEVDLRVAPGNVVTRDKHGTNLLAVLHNKNTDPLGIVT